MAVARKYAGPERVKVRGNASSPDPHETEALAHAAETAGVTPDKATAVITAWIMKRAELSAGARLAENLAFDLGDAKLRGFVSAALPAIGGAVDVPPGVAFYDLDRDAVVDLFTLAFSAIQEAAVAAGECPTVMGERIPF